MNNWLQLALAFVGLVVGIMVIRFFFENFFVSRVLSLVCCGASLWTTITSQGMDVTVPCWILCVLGWLFFMGENLFDCHETGWVTIDEWGFRTKETEGGFFSHLLWAAIVIGLIFFFMGNTGLSIVYYLVPGITMVRSAASFVTRG